MNQLTLVLPCALPNAELAADLLKVLQAPALAALLSRTSSSNLETFDTAQRLLPHEAWLAHALGLAPAPNGAAAQAAFAVEAMRGYGLAPAPGARYFLLHPAHLAIARSHISLEDLRQLKLSEEDGRALFDTARPYFDEIGQPLAYGDAGTWFMRADGWSDLQCASPDGASTQDLSVWMPEGEHARAARRLQNEVQMLWHEHPVNAAREERGLKAINSFWVWGAGLATAQRPPCAASLHTADAPGWLAALAEPAQRHASPNSVLAGKQDALVVLGGLIEPAQAQEWGLWLQQLQALEAHWFAPLLAALKDGRLGRLRLVLSHRDAWLDVTTGKHAQRKFWRAPTLNKLKAS
ncbi:hypothetical protein [Janthinobacterium sp. 1_2014MBL_MicDiv]|uniref:hypothetical protein n=1 Tax=Janthinobacterium sp. 1_2014MBL_MicDiv TaxID=1644131 RepID=UPI0008F46D19|nr:hypothetical protein [Janthinobacterium sp. 1_2014MBL_MicDiv]APA71274.1 hypothetical protein YQ44_10000 [Janthinobacterium sp. 1_2014MBL_MicDiv]